MSMKIKRAIFCIWTVSLLSASLASCSFGPKADDDYVIGKDYSDMPIDDFLDKIVSKHSYSKRMAIWTNWQAQYPEIEYDPEGDSQFSRKYSGAGFMPFNFKDKTVFAMLDEDKGVVRETIEEDRIVLTRGRCEELGLIGDLRNDIKLDFLMRPVELSYHRSSLNFPLDFGFLRQLGAMDSVVAWPFYDHKSFDDLIDAEYRRNYWHKDMFYYVPAYTIYEDDMSGVYGVLTFDSNGYARSFLKEDDWCDSIGLFEFYIKLYKDLIDTSRCAFCFTPEQFKPGWWQLAFDREFYPEQKKSFEIEEKYSTTKYTFDEKEHQFTKEVIIKEQSE